MITRRKDDRRQSTYAAARHIMDVRNALELMGNAGFAMDRARMVVLVTKLTNALEELNGRRG